MTWVWVAIVTAIGGVLAETIRRRGQRAEVAFFSDDAWVAKKVTQIRQRRWIRPLSRVGAIALLLVYAAVMAFFVFALPGAIAVSVLGNGMAPAWFGAGLVLSLVIAIFAAPVGIAATILCRCGQCAGWLFDNSQPPRKGFLGASRENWRFVRGRGRCPRCGEAA